MKMEIQTELRKRGNFHKIEAKIYGIAMRNTQEYKNKGKYSELAELYTEYYRKLMISDHDIGTYGTEIPLMLYYDESVDYFNVEKSISKQIKLYSSSMDLPEHIGKRTMYRFFLEAVYLSKFWNDITTLNQLLIDGNKIQLMFYPDTKFEFGIDAHLYEGEEHNDTPYAKNILIPIDHIKNCEMSGSCICIYVEGGEDGNITIFEIQRQFNGTLLQLRNKIMNRVRTKISDDFIEEPSMIVYKTQENVIQISITFS